MSLGYHTFKRWPMDIYRISCASWVNFCEFFSSKFETLNHLKNSSSTRGASSNWRCGSRFQRGNFFYSKKYILPFYFPAKWEGKGLVDVSTLLLMMAIIKPSHEWARYRRTKRGSPDTRKKKVSQCSDPRASKKFSQRNNENNNFSFTQPLKYC